MTLTDRVGWTDMAYDDIEALKQKWANDIAKRLVGAIITNVRYLSAEECEDNDWYSAPAVLEMTGRNGRTFAIYAMQDDEGNDGGALGTSLEELPTIPVI